MSTFLIEQELQRVMYAVATSAYPASYDLARLEELVRQLRVRRAEPALEGAVD